MDRTSPSPALLSVSGEHPLWLINTLLLMVFSLEFGGMEKQGGGMGEGVKTYFLSLNK